MIKKLLAIFSLVTTLSTVSYGSDVKLMWDPLCNTNLLGSTVYFTTNKLTTAVINIFPAYVDDCGTNRLASTNVYWGNYNLTNAAYRVEAPGWTNTTVTVSNVVKGATYYFVVTCKTSTIESDRSNEVVYTVPFYSSNSVPSKVSGVRIIFIQ